MWGPADRFESFVGGGLHGEISSRCRPSDIVAEAARLTDPLSATSTIHWGRNYLYTADLRCADGVIPVVVKQFRNQGLRRRLERWLRGSKATRSWRVAMSLLRAGIGTPEPVALIESDRSDGPSFFVTRQLEDAREVRQFFRRLNGEPDPGPFPEVDDLEFLDQLGRFARGLHDSGVVFRDLSMGNILAVGEGPQPELQLVDLNRARVDRHPGVWRRTRDICRLPILGGPHREAFLRGYWGEVPRRWSIRWWLFVLSVNAYIAKHAVKRNLRRLRVRGNHAHRGGHHDHIPPASKDAGRRDRSVWDPLSDQPHQHAGRWTKRWIRLVDAPAHVRELAIVTLAAPRIWKRYLELNHRLHRDPAPIDGIGLCLRPWPDDLDMQLAEVDELGVRSVLLRLHPWESNHDLEEALAHELHNRGCDLVFALPQVRELVTDRHRWRDAVEELGERFSPYGSYFQIGQAVNRSKWGIWTRGEYVSLYRTASEVLRRHDGVRLVGPAAIDFEFQITAALANVSARGLEFDVVSSLLYVDRRGAPENHQMGFNTIDKVLLLKAIADTGRNSTSGRVWITEVNWPLWEGPHSPAGVTVAVNEESHADFLVRYYLLALSTGAVERVYWWRLIARGYGLIAPEADGSLRRRPAWYALKTMIAELAGATFTGSLETARGGWLYRFERDDDVVIVAWSLAAGGVAELPARPRRVVSRDGVELRPPDGTTINTGPSPVYYVLDD